MSVESYALANSRPHGFPVGRAEPNFLQRLHPLSAPQRAESYFGRVVPVSKYKSDMSETLRLVTQSRNIPVLTVEVDMPLHDRRAALTRPWFRVSGDTNFRNSLGAEATGSSRRAAATRYSVVNRTAVPVSHASLSFGHIDAEMFPTPGAQSFLLIERVKDLLNRQRIRDARRTLELGSIHFPEIPQITDLLRAISPGRVLPTVRTSTGRERENTWIKQYGHKYRGHWIALEEDRLIAFAGTLKELVASIDTKDEREQPLFIQHLLSE